MSDDTLTVGTDRAAPNGALRLSDLMRVLQDRTVTLFESVGDGYDAVSERGLAWVVTRYRFEIRRMPRYLETVRIELRCAKPRHGVYPIEYGVIAPDGETIVLAVGHWRLIDTNSRSASGDDSVHLPVTLERPALKTTLNIRPTGRVSVTRHRADYSRCDMNGHMNNTRYLDLAESLLPCDYQMAHAVTQADVIYRSEIPMDASFDVQLFEDGNTFYFEGLGPQRLFLIQLTYGDPGKGD